VWPASPHLRLVKRVCFPFRGRSPKFHSFRERLNIYASFLQSGEEKNANRDLVRYGWTKRQKPESAFSLPLPSANPFLPEWVQTSRPRGLIRKSVFPMRETAGALDPSH